MSICHFVCLCICLSAISICLTVVSICLSIPSEEWTCVCRVHLPVHHVQLRVCYYLSVCVPCPSVFLSHPSAHLSFICLSVISISLCVMNTGFNTYFEWIISLNFTQRPLFPFVRPGKISEYLQRTDGKCKNKNITDF